VDGRTERGIGVQRPTRKVTNRAEAGRSVVAVRGVRRRLVLILRLRFPLGSPPWKQEAT
jgi:hypothetical protein